MGSYKKIGLSHEMGLIDTPPSNNILFSKRDVIYIQGLFVRTKLGRTLMVPKDNFLDQFD